MANYLFDISLIIIVATVVAYILRALKQPAVLAYLLAGVLIGPVGLRLITNYDAIYTLAEIGIAFFLFIVGLEMKIDKLKSLAKPIFLVSIGQAVITFIFGYLIAGIFFEPKASFFIAIALTFSSTMVVMKLLSDKNQIDTLHGRIIIGIMIVQDMIAILAIAFMQSFSNFSLTVAAGSLVKAVLLVSVSLFSGIFLLPRIFRFAAKSQDLLFTSAISWCFVVVLFSNFLGLSIAIGGFVAGLALAQLQYSHDISAKVRPLRDFFSVIFFVSLGMMMLPDMAGIDLASVAILALFVIIGNPLIVMTIMGAIGYSKKLSFLTGLGIGQASEFSLILAIQATALGFITRQTLSFIVVVTAITLVVTAYLIKYDTVIYSRISGYLNVFEFRKKKIDSLYSRGSEDHYDAVLFGCDRVGYSIIGALERKKYRFIVVDYNPEIISRLAAKKIPCVYEDFSDPALFERINIKRQKIFISTIPDFDANMHLITKVRELNRNAVIFVTALTIDETLEMYKAGADYVILPHFLGGEHTAHILNEMTPKNMLKLKEKHIEELFSRKELKHEHPKR